MKKLISFALAFIMLVSAFSGFCITTSAAATIQEHKNLTMKNAKTGQFLNYDYGTLQNGTVVRCWPWDGSAEQKWNIVHIKDDIYRLVASSGTKFALDVYRGNSKLKAGQKIDIWKAGDDTVAQNLNLYKCSNGNYILRMDNNPSLAISANGSKNQLKLVKFNANDKAQQWTFMDASKNKVDIEKAPASTVLSNRYYEKTGVSYTVEGKRYHLAETIVKIGNISAGEEFWIDSKGVVVTDGTLLGKLRSIDLFNIQRLELMSTVERFVDSAQKYNDVYIDIKASRKLGNIVGKSSGLLLSIGAGNAFGIDEAAIEFFGEVASPETFKELLFINILETYVMNTISNGKYAMSLLQNYIIDFDTMTKAKTAYASTLANFAVVKYIAGDEAIEMAESSTLKELGKYFEDVVLGFADSIIPDIKAVQITKYVTDGVVCLADFATSCGVADAYNKKYNEIMSSPAFSVKTYSNEKSLKIAEGPWESLVGKTVASIKKNSSFTKYYNASGNISARGGFIGQCTWYALGRFTEVTGINLGKAYNANTWLEDNKNNKKVTILYGANKIVPQSIAVDKSGTYGHVMFVEDVVYDTAGNPVWVYFTECNKDGNDKYDAGEDCILKKMSYSEFVKQRGPDGYIAAK